MALWAIAWVRTVELRGYNCSPGYRLCNGFFLQRFYKAFSSSFCFTRTSRCWCIIHQRLPVHLTPLLSTPRCASFLSCPYLFCFLFVSCASFSSVFRERLRLLGDVASLWACRSPQQYQDHLETTRNGTLGPDLA